MTYSSYLSTVRPTGNESTYRSTSPLSRMRYGSHTRGREEKMDHGDNRVRFHNNNSHMEKRPTHRPNERFSDDASINTNMLNDAINNALDNAPGKTNPDGGNNNMHGNQNSRLPPSRTTHNIRSTGSPRSHQYVAPPPPPPSPPSQIPPTRQRRFATGYDDDRDVSPVKELRTKPSRPVSPLDERTLSNNDYNQAQYHARQADQGDRSNDYNQAQYNPRQADQGDRTYASERYPSLNRDRQREFEKSVYSQRRDDVMTAASYRRSMDLHTNPRRGVESSVYTPSSRTYRSAYERRPPSDYSDRMLDHHSRIHPERDTYDDRRSYSVGRHRIERENYVSTDSYADRRSRSVGRQRHIVETDNTSRYTNNSGTSIARKDTGKDTLMTFEVVKDGENIKLRSRNPSPMPSSSKIPSSTTLYEFSPQKERERQYERTGRNEFVIKVESGVAESNVAPVRENPNTIASASTQLHHTDHRAVQNAENSVAQQIPKSGSIALNYNDILGDQSVHQSTIENVHRSRGGFPVVDSTLNQDVNVAKSGSSEMSSMTGMPKTTRTVMTSASNASRWKNNDVIMLPKGQPTAEASVATAAAASLIVNDIEGACNFEAAVKSVSNMVASTPTGLEDATLIVRPSISHDDLRYFDDDKIIPISFSKVKLNMKEAIKERRRNNDKDESANSKKIMQASDFYARCAMLAATAIMKADPNDKAIIAQTAAETVLGFYNAQNSEKDWMQRAESDLRNVADEVSNAIHMLPIESSRAMASLASIAVLGEGGKTLAMQRIRHRVRDIDDTPEITVVASESKSFNDDREEEDIISPVRQRGSLMDISSSEDTEDSKEVEKIPSESRSMKPTQERSVSPTQNVIFSSKSNISSTNQQTEIQKKKSLSPSKDDSPQYKKSLSSSRDESPHYKKPMSFNKDATAREMKKAAVRKLLGSFSGSDDDCKSEDTNNKPKTRSHLDRKQSEIAKRIQRIQMRAAGHKAEDIATVISRKNSRSNDSSSPYPQTDYTRNYAHVNRNKSNVSADKSTITGDNLAEIPSAKEMIEGIGAVVTPVLSYLGSIKIDTLKDKLKIPSLPQCKMDTVNCEKSTEIQMKIPRTVTYVNDEDSIDNSIENSQQVANQSIQSNLSNLGEESYNNVKKRHGERAYYNLQKPKLNNGENNSKGRLAPAISNLSDDQPPDDWTSFRSPPQQLKQQQEQQQETNRSQSSPLRQQSLSSSSSESSEVKHQHKSAPKTQTHQNLQSQSSDSSLKSIPTRSQRVDKSSLRTDNAQKNSITNNRHSRESLSIHNHLQRKKSTDTTGAFSAAFNNGDFSNIPIQRLSLTPSGVTDTAAVTTKDLFFSNTSSNRRTGASETSYNSRVSSSPSSRTSKQSSAPKSNSRNRDLSSSRNGSDSSTIRSNMLDSLRGNSERNGLIDGQRKERKTTNNTPKKKEKMRNRLFPRHKKKGQQEDSFYI